MNDKNNIVKVRVPAPAEDIMPVKKKKTGKEGWSSPTPYDDAIITLITRHPRLFIPVINHAFGKHYSLNEEVILEPTVNMLDHPDRSQDRTLTDGLLYFKSTRERYLVECKATPDSSLYLQVAEYWLATAVRHTESSKDVIEVNLPIPFVLCLRSNGFSNDFAIRLNAPDGRSLSYTVKSVQVPMISLDTIFRENLYLLVPFHIFAFESSLETCDNDPDRLKELQKTYWNILDQLKSAQKNGILSTSDRWDIIDLTIKVSEHLAAPFDNVKEAISSMRGHIIKTEAGAIFDEGKKEGKEEGRRENQKANAVALIQNNVDPEVVIKSLGIDQETLDAWLKEAAESARKNS